MSTAWYLVQAKVGHERLAQFNLRRQGYQTYLPGIRKIVRHARKTRVDLAALFPGYLFIALDAERDRWRQVDSTIGVVRLVTNLERPLRAPRHIVDLLMARSDADGIVDLAGQLGAGDAVRVVQGPFADHEGVIDRLAGPDRVRILMILLGNEVVVELSRGAYEAA